MHCFPLIAAQQHARDFMQFRSRSIIRNTSLLLSLVAVLALAFAWQAGNPTVRQGSSASFAPTGTEGAAVGRVWDILNSSGATVARDAVPNGWTVAIPNGTFTVGAPSNAVIGTNYKVRFTADSGTGLAAPGEGLAAPEEGVVAAVPGGDENASALFDVVASLPAAPTSLTASSISATQINLTWVDNANNETGFKLDRKTGAGGTWSQIATPAANATTFSNTGLTAGITYFYRVLGTNSGGDSAYSNEASATTRPGTPGGLAATPGDARVTLTWSAPAGASTYNVKRSLVNGGPYTVVASGIATTSYTNTGLINGTTYYFVVSASNAGGEGLNSFQVSATPAAPLPPTNVRTTTFGDRFVDIAWDAASGATSYSVKYATTSGGLYTVSGTGITGTTHRITGLINGMFYYVVVTAHYAGGGSANSTEHGTGPVGARDAPTNLVATPGNGIITLTWNDQPAHPSLVFYKIMRGTISGGPYESIAAEAYYEGLSYTDTRVVPGTTYYYVVISGSNGGYYSPPSNEASAASTTGIPPAPTGLAATAGVNQVQLSWTAATGATSYIVRRSGSAGGPYTDVATGVAGTSYADTTATAGSTYYYVVAGSNSYGASANSNEVSATPYALATPANFTATRVGQLSIHLEWGAVNGATSYTIDRSYSQPGPPWTVLGTTATTSFDTSGPSNTLVILRVKATSPTGESDYAVASVTTLPNTPTVTEITPGDGQITLRWIAEERAPNQPIITYHLKRSPTAGGSYTEVFSTTGDVRIDPVENGARYYYVLSATNGSGETPNGGERDAWAGAPLAPVLTAAPANGKVTLTWTLANGADSYTVRRSTTSGQSYSVIASGVAPLTFEDSGLTNGTTYYYLVAADNVVGSTESNEASSTPDVPPVAPTNLNASAVSSTRIDLSWSDNASNEAGYRIERRTGLSGTWAQVASVSTNNTSFSNTGLAPQTLYYYRVRAYNSVANSGYSNEAFASTLPEPSPAPYLKQVVIADDCLIGSGSTTGVVRLSGSTPSPALVALRSTSEFVTIPTSVTIPAGASETSFTIVYDQPGTLSVSHVYATLQSWVQRAKIATIPTGSSIFPSDLLAASGQGGIWLSWIGQEEDVFGSSFEGYSILRSVDGGPYVEITSRATTVSSFVDMAVITGSVYRYKVGVKAQGGSVIGLTGESAATYLGLGPSIEWITTPPPVVVGNLIVSARNPDPQEETYMLYVDGVPTATGRATTSTGGTSLVIEAQLDTASLADGAHSIFFAAVDDGALLAASAPLSFISANSVHSLSSDGVAELSTGDYCEVVAELPASSVNYTVTLESTAGVVLRTWQGVGSSVRLLWDGTDENGVPVADDEYKVGVGNPGDQKYVSVYKIGRRPVFLAVVTVKPDYLPQAAVNYANYIKSALATLRQNTGNLDYLVLTVGEHTNLSRTWADKLRRWLRESVRYFYLNGHGRRTNEGVTDHTVWIGNNIELRNFRRRNQDPFTITIPTTVGTRPYSFVWLDCCHTGGSNKSGIPADTWLTGMTRFPHTRWATAFNVDTRPGYYNGAFIGNNGTCTFPTPTTVNNNGGSWERWRRLFWEGFAIQNHTISDSLRLADIRLESWRPDPNPRSFCNALNQPKRVTAGDFQF